MTNISIQTLTEELHMEAKNSNGGVIRIDGNREVGGLEGGISPMEMLLAAAGGCSTIDIIRILKKQKQPLEGIHVDVNGDRQKVGTYSEYKSIHLHFTLRGDLDPKKVERAIELSVGKYCSVSKALEHTAEIKHSYEIISNE